MNQTIVPITTETGNEISNLEKIGGLNDLSRALNRNALVQLRQMTH